MSRENSVIDPATFSLVVTRFHV